MSTSIWVTTRVIGYHRWPEAPEAQSFLRYSHRHEFHVKVKMNVDHANRALEFFDEQRKLRALLAEVYEANAYGELIFGGRSCEDIACSILYYHPHYTSVEVSEDGENGAEVTRET